MQRVPYSTVFDTAPHGTTYPPMDTTRIGTYMRVTSFVVGELGKSPLKRRRNAAINELKSLKYLPRSTVEREVSFFKFP